VEWSSGGLDLDVKFGYLDGTTTAPRRRSPHIVLNSESDSMLRALREELRHCSTFMFSVAFVSPRAIALLKQELVEFEGEGCIVTSDYLGFNSPQAFAELMNLNRLGIETRIHPDPGYHPKGYVFNYPDGVTAILGSSNLTESALAQNLELNLRVSAAPESDLAGQLERLVESQRQESAPITADWIDSYAASYVRPAHPDFTRVEPPPDALFDSTTLLAESEDVSLAYSLTPALTGAIANTETVLPEVAQFIEPAEANELHKTPTNGAQLRKPLVANQMQQEALLAIDALRRDGKRKALVISATGTGKTILAALDVRAAKPERMLFVVHREQILDRAIQEFSRVLGAPLSDFGKLTGGWKQRDRKYVFSTIQTLSMEGTLCDLDPRAFDYILIDEVHRAGAASYGRVLDHFAPNFLLGMTATPERSDGASIFELFDYNVAYEIRLNRALEDDMLCPFHYYGVADVLFDDGTTTTDVTEVRQLASRLRVSHILDAFETYAQAGVQPRGLIFCSRKEEAHAISSTLNESVFRGRPLRTVALTGDDSVSRREDAVRSLESGELDYILTVDIFNEGVDIPSVNQVVMLRQTQSAIVFVQQLGRGLRKHPGKEHVVVIDFIGNYANNYLIPIALFGDDSLNKESIRKSLIAAEEAGVMAGLSSVRFDRLSQERVIRAIVETKLDSMSNLKAAMDLLRNRLGRVPLLHDFLQFESADPVLLATKMGNYPALVEKLTKGDAGLTAGERDALTLLSNEAFDAKRPHELLLLRTLLDEGSVSAARALKAFQAHGAAADAKHFASAVRSLDLSFNTEQERTKYKRSLVSSFEGLITLTPEFSSSYEQSEPFRTAVDDLITTGLELISARYDPRSVFTPGRQYSRKDSCRLLCWDKNVTATIYGYRVDKPTETCPIFVTYHKSTDIAASTAYEDELLDRRTMRWFTRSRRTLRSDEVASIVSNDVAIYVFAKKDDAEGSDFYFLGRAHSTDAVETHMQQGEPLPVVRVGLQFASPINAAVYDYFHPVVMGS
jgi:superfamily II DNA or RNA helicase/HKD family nuclease